MRIRVHALALSLVVGLSTLLITGHAQAAGSCHKINAKGVGQDLGGGITQAHVIGGGLLHGTTAGNFAITGISDGVATITGTVAFTANKGTLSVSVSGTFNTNTGAFSAAGPVAASTGKLGGASGNLSFNGVESLADGSFVENIDGEICVPQ
jgi:hypothetical protein